MLVFAKLAVAANALSLILFPAPVPGPYKDPLPRPEILKAVDEAAKEPDSTKAIKVLDLALAQASSLKDECGMGVVALKLGEIYLAANDLAKAQDYFEQSARHSEKCGALFAKTEALGDIGAVYRSRRDFAKSDGMYRSALALAKQIDSKGLQGRITLNFATNCDLQSRRAEAIAFYLQAIPLLHADGDRKGESVAYGSIGVDYYRLARYPEAEAAYLEVLTICQELHDRTTEADTLKSLGMIDQALSRWAPAIDYFKRAIALNQELGHRSEMAKSVNALGTLYDAIGQLALARECFEQAIPVFRELKDMDALGSSVDNLGHVFDVMGDPKGALEKYREALAIYVDLKDEAGQGDCLNNIGHAYFTLTQPDEAVDYFKQALAIQRKQHKTQDQAITLMNLAASYDLGKHPDEAFQSYTRALVLQRASSLPLVEASDLYNLSTMFRRPNPNLALLYSKLAVGVLKKFFTGNRDLSPSDLSALIQQWRGKMDTWATIAANETPRAVETLCFLDLKKRDASEWNIELTPRETKWAAEYDAKVREYVELNRKVQMAQTASSPQGADANDRLAKELEAKEDEFVTWHTRVAKEALTKTPEDNLRPRVVKEFLDTVKSLPKGSFTVSMLRYAGSTIFLVTGDQGMVIKYVIAKEVGGIDTKHMTEAVAQFTAALQNPALDPKPSGKILYDALVKPIEEELKGAKTVMWELPTSLRGVPMDALWDGNQYLAQRWNNSRFSCSWSGLLTKQPTGDWSGVVASSSQRWQVKGPVTAQPIDFDGLPGAAQEMDSVSGLLPNSTILRDSQFTPDAFKKALESQPKIVHLISHFRSFPGDDRRALLLCGNGQALSVESLKSLPTNALTRTELVVLSACATAVGEKGNGTEIDSFSDWMQMKGAQAVVSTLWPVSDEATRLLMTRFYKYHLDHKDWPKIQCLRQAQLDLLSGQVKGSGGVRATSVGTENTFKPDPNAPLSHPYYWAPFILNGNWK